MNSTALYILFAILISVIAQATNTDLANNTSFLLLLLLALGAYGQNNNNNNNCCCNNFNQRSFF
ncbi:MAG: hypothetical protein E7374_02165 [Clostridiales bacterium]|nr:hypothetical protein [Clostridiales bacterium]